MTPQEAGLYRIWKEAFNEDDDYIALFLKEGRPLGHTLACGPAHAPYAALTLFPVTLQLDGTHYPGYYLYALGVLQAQRGKGHGSRLVRQAHAHAFRNGGAFILLQPAHTSLFAYYHRLGYTIPVSRASFSCTRAALEACTAPESSTPTCPNPLHALSGTPPNRFIWPPPMRAYIRAECLRRGGAIIWETAYCYPNQDDSGSFVEIREYDLPLQQGSVPTRQLLDAFPRAARFIFYGKPQRQPLPSPLQQAPFALLHAIDPAAETLYRRRYLYFALGLD